MKFKLKQPEGFNIVKGNNTIDAYEKLLRLDTAVGIEETTYNDLLVKKRTGKLFPGKYYRIIDYMTMTSQENTQSAGHQFDIIVQALDKQTLSEDAKAILHKGDTYFSEKGCILESWELKYSLENDATKFAWAVPTQRVLYVGEYSTFIYSDPEDPTSEIIGVDTSSYTGISNTSFTYFLSGAFVEGDATVYQAFMSNDFTKVILLPENTSEAFDNTTGGDPGENPIIPFIVASSDEQLTERYNVYQYPVVKIGLDGGKGVIYKMKDEKNNECPYDFKNIQFLRKISGIELDEENGEDTYVYTFTLMSDEGEDVQVLDGTCLAEVQDGSNNQFYVSDNKMETYINDNSGYNYILPNNVFIRNTASHYYDYITGNHIHGSYNDNTFIGGVYHNDFGGICRESLFNFPEGNVILSSAFVFNFNSGFNSSDNIFDNQVYNVNCDERCCHNHFSNVSGITMGEHCEYNNFTNVSNITMEENCSYNTISNCSAITFNKPYTKNVEIDWCNGITLTSSQTTNETNLLQNIKIMTGTNTDENNVKTITHQTVNDTGLTIYKGNNITEVTV